MEARLAEGAGDLDRSLAIYEAVLRGHGDPDLHRQAYAIAKKLGKKGVAQRHFDAAEAGFVAPLKGGEVYTLEGMARLYCEAGVHLTAARDLARRNLRTKRDASARAALACLKEALGKARLSERIPMVDEAVTAYWSHRTYDGARTPRHASSLGGPGLEWLGCTATVLRGEEVEAHYHRYRNRRLVEYVTPPRCSSASRPCRNGCVSTVTSPGAIDGSAWLVGLSSVRAA